MTRVHQALAAAGRHDAVTAQAQAYRRLIGSWGYEGADHSAGVEPGYRAGLLPIDRLDGAPDDLVIVHYSGWVPRMAPLLATPPRKLLVYHNVTPARYFWNFQPHVAVICELGRDHLPRYARAARVAAAMSEFSAAELRTAGAGDVRVVPILLELDRLAGRAPAPLPAGDGPLVLVVGRLAPHKRHDLVIRSFALYQRHCAPDARLLCVGGAVTPAYRERLEELARRLGARGVSIGARLEQEELNSAYAEAAVLLSLSEHEGFCVPLLEAFHFGLPVVARAAGAVPEVGGDAILDPGEPPDPAVIAELIDLAVRDGELREELARRGRARLERFSYERSAEELRSAVQAALA